MLSMKHHKPGLGGWGSWSLVRTLWVQIPMLGAYHLCSLNYNERFLNLVLCVPQSLFRHKMLVISLAAGAKYVNMRGGFIRLVVPPFVV